MKLLGKLLVSAAFLAITVPAVATQTDSELRKEAAEFFEVIPSVIPAIKDNAITHAKIELGKKLFFEPRLSKSGFISCNSCHNVGMGGGDNLETSVGHGWQTGPRNAPTVLNAVFNTAQFWDGRAADLKEQAKGPIQAGVEMASTPERVIATLKSMPRYVEDFKVAFPGEEDPVTFDNVAKAIEAFEATLVTPAARFDQFLEGNDKILTTEEKQGLSLFMEKGCTTCHNGVNFGGNGYFPFGMVEKPDASILPENDPGRYTVTKTEDEKYVFRASPLRNVALTAPYFHSGKVWELESAVRVMGTAQLGVTLEDNEVKAITAFLKTLTGEQPRIEYPILPISTATTPKPELMIPPPPAPEKAPAKK
ncbi:cytochrome-c peroxidase [Microvirga sp. W0021]|uniref:Cytochrome-c peroxidase n=1 Tax=Hohaiivirga grylli TaxID=3133970 RepID=A0ABV0BJ40_9HYPH